MQRYRSLSKCRPGKNIMKCGLETLGFLSEAWGMDMDLVNMDMVLKAGEL